MEIIAAKPPSFKIGGTDCSFTKESDDCPIKYKAKGTCNLHIVSTQLFPNINLEESTNRFIVTAKFETARLEIFACQGNPKDGMVSFVAKSVESVELVPQQLTLGAEARLKVSWSTLAIFDPKKLEVKVRGFTSIGQFSIIVSQNLYIYHLHHILVAFDSKKGTDKIELQVKLKFVMQQSYTSDKMSH